MNLNKDLKYKDLYWSYRWANTITWVFSAFIIMADMLNGDFKPESGLATILAVFLLWGQLFVFLLVPAIAIEFIAKKSKGVDIEVWPRIGAFLFFLFLLVILSQLTVP